MKSLLTLIFCLSLGALSVSAQHTELIRTSQSPAFSGLKVTYNEQGQKTAEIEYLNGQPEGKISRFYSNGQVREMGFYLNGKKHGSWSSYNDQGQLLSTAHFNEGNKDGEWMVWDNQGNLRYKLTYKNGSPIGEWAMYDVDGKLSERKVIAEDSRNASKE